MKTAPLFRGKRVDGKGEVEGGFVESPLGKHSAIIIYSGDAYEQRPEFVEVDPSTVEQIAGDMVDEVNALREQITDNPFCAQCPYFESKDCQVRADETCHWTRDMHEHSSKTHEDAPQSTNDTQDG